MTHHGPAESIHQMMPEVFQPQLNLIFPNLPAVVFGAFGSGSGDRADPINLQNDE
jgi:hypothetical protein